MQTASDSISTTTLPASYPDRKAGSKWTVRRWWILAAVIVVIAGLTLGLRSVAVNWVERLMGREEASGACHVVEPTTLQITLTEDGELRPRKSAEIKCQVEGQSTILYVVDESTRVKKGDLLVELASDELEERRRAKQMEVDQIQADYDAAVAELEIQRNQNEANIQAAEINLKVAELDLEKYLKGDFVGQLKAIDLQIEQTEMDIRRKETDLEENRELAAKGWVTSNEIEDYEFALKVAQMQLERHQLSKEILLNYERPKVEMQRTSAVDRTRSALQDEQKRAKSREAKSVARVRQYTAQLENSREGLAKIEKQIKNCKMYAPTDGIVQYPVDDRHRWGGGERIAAGERVYEGQTLVVLPDTSQMLVSTRIHEADRHLIREGLPCLVRVPAVPGQSFTGTIGKIDKFADSENRWLNPDLKEHGTEIVLDETDAPLSPGDSAEVKILIDMIEDTLAVPVQCVFTRGADSYVFVRSGATADPVKVKLGRSNASMVQILEGLEGGQRVVMHADEQMLARLPTVGTAVAENHVALAKPDQNPPTARAERSPGRPEGGEGSAQAKPAGGGEAAKAKNGD